MSRILHLLRHAKSSWDQPAESDFDRPLAPRGERAAVLIAAHFERSGHSPGLIVSSPSRRTRQTLEPLLGLFCPSPEVRFEESIYGAGANRLIALIQGFDDAVDEALLLGHNPAIQFLAAALCGPGGASLLDSKYPTGGLATIALTVERWHGVWAGCGELLRFVRPRDLAAAYEVGTE